MGLRRLIFPLLVTTALAGPYVASKTPQVAERAQQTWQSLAGSPPKKESESVEIEPPDGGDSLLGDAAPRWKQIGKVPLEGVPVYDLSDVLRMDVTTAWVYSRWSRKSTALADLDLYGIRVPLVTGTGVDDLAGSLTYYFNPAGRVQRISFRGRTGDTRKLVSLLISRFGFRLQPPRVSGEQLYQVRWNGKPISQLRIRPAPVIWASAPHASFSVELELERPGSGRFLDSDPPAVSLAPSPDEVK